MIDIYLRFNADSEKRGVLTKSWRDLNNRQCAVEHPALYLFPSHSYLSERIFDRLKNTAFVSYGLVMLHVPL